MLPVTQSILADPSRNDGHDASGQPGDCYRAAIASVLELPLHEVPHFAAFGDQWQEKSEEWLLGRGIGRCFYWGDWLEGLHYPIWVGPEGLELREGIVADHVIGALGAGPSPRGDFRHVVVLDHQTGATIHDPHPSRRGLDEIDEVEVFFALRSEAR